MRPRTSGPSFFGEPSERDREPFEHMMKARDYLLHGQARYEDIELATQEYFKSVGFGDAICHRGAR